MARIGIIGGTSAELDFLWGESGDIATRYGPVPVLRASAGETEVVFLRRHGAAHERISSQVDHRANVSALAEAGCEAVIATTVCGVLDASQPLGSLIVFDDLFFPDNRLPDGAPCTFFDTPGAPGRGHHIFGSPFSPALRESLAGSARDAGLPVRVGGTYAYSLGPRFNSASEVAWMRSAGAIAVSQTAGPEAVLCGELELPYALVGFGVDYANGVVDEPTPVAVMDANIAASRSVFSALLGAAVGSAGSPCFDTGFVYRFE